MGRSSDSLLASGKIRVGIVGVGNWAQYGHIPALQLLPQYEIVSVYARRREVAQAVASQHGIGHVAATVSELANRADVDLVLVLTTAPQHEEGIRAAVAAGKDVYSEWPLTPSNETSRVLAKLADDAGVRHVAGLQRRLSPTNRYLRDLIGQDYVGKIRSVRLHVSTSYLQAHRPASLAWTAPSKNFSSVLAIYGGHFLDALTAVVGTLENVSGMALNQFPVVTIQETGETIATTAPDQFAAIATLKDGGGLVSVHVEGGKRNGSGVQLDITGHAGDLKVTNVSAFGGHGQDYLIAGANGDGVPLATLDVPASYDALPLNELPSAVRELAHLYAAFARDMATGSRTAPNFEDAIRVHALIDEAVGTNAGSLRRHAA